MGVAILAIVGSVGSAPGVVVGVAGLQFPLAFCIFTIAAHDNA